VKDAANETLFSTEENMATQHHGKPEDFQQPEIVKRFLEQMTGQYQRKFPDGRQGPDDDGELTYAIATDRKHKTIVIRFAHPTEWIGLHLEAAIELKKALTSRIVELQTLAEQPTTP
jgi:hypothetical protein